MAEVGTSATALKTSRKASSGNGKRSKPAKAPHAAPFTMAEIEHLTGAPIDFNDIYTRTDEPVRRKLFAVAAAQQLREFVQKSRTGTKARNALTDAEMISEICAWTPVMKRRGIGTVAKAAKVVAQMTAEEKAELARLLNG